MEKLVKLIDVLVGWNPRILILPWRGVEWNGMYLQWGGIRRFLENGAGGFDFPSSGLRSQLACRSDAFCSIVQRRF